MKNASEIEILESVFRSISLPGGAKIVSKIRIEHKAINSWSILIGETSLYVIHNV